MTNPGICACGCGEKTKVHANGTHRKFVKGHVKMANWVKPAECMKATMDEKEDKRKLKI